MQAGHRALGTQGHMGMLLLKLSTNFLGGVLMSFLCFIISGAKEQVTIIR